MYMMMLICAWIIRTRIHRKCSVCNLLQYSNEENPKVIGLSQVENEYGTIHMDVEKSNHGRRRSESQSQIFNLATQKLERYI